MSPKEGQLPARTGFNVRNNRVCPQKLIPTHEFSKVSDFLMRDLGQPRSQRSHELSPEFLAWECPLELSAPALLSASSTPLLPFPIPPSPKTLKIGLFPSQGCSGGGWMELSPSEIPTQCRIPVDPMGSWIPPCLQSSGRGRGGSEAGRGTRGHPRAGRVRPRQPQDGVWE